MFLLKGLGCIQVGGGVFCCSEEGMSQNFFVDGCGEFFLLVCNDNDNDIFEFDIWFEIFYCFFCLLMIYLFKLCLI